MSVMKLKLVENAPSLLGVEDLIEGSRGVGVEIVQDDANEG